MTGPLGIWQHADGTEPDVAFGTCTDDVSRALTVDLLQRRTLGWEAVLTTSRRSMAYLRAAFDPALGTFRDFRGADGEWLDEAGSQDCQGRALLSLGIAARDAPEVGLRGEARALFDAALPAARRLTSPRAVASVILGCDAALEAPSDEGTRAALSASVQRLRSAFWEVDPDSDWLWPESELTYENALLPHALIVAGHRLADPGLRRVGLEVLDWLIAIQTTRRGMFTPVGNDGWWQRGGTRSRFAQQPIEATALILAAAAASEVTADVAYRRAAESAYAWFLGDNEGSVVLADAATGGCRDGLEEDGPNQNQGAESTLMWLTAVETMRAMRTHAGAIRARTLGRRATLVEVR
jgi:hypothetical protein